MDFKVIRKSVSMQSFIDPLMNHNGIKMTRNKSMSDFASNTISDSRYLQNTNAKAIEDIEHVSAYVPLNNLAKCLISHPFPVDVISKDDNLEVSICLADPGCFNENNETTDEEEESTTMKRSQSNRLSSKKKRRM
jgi:hypothetical protein